MTQETATVYVALLRGINVGGRTTMAMEQLRATVASTGCTDVATYIQSGNVVLTSPLPEAELRTALERAIADQLEVSPTVMVRTAEEVADVVDRSPYPDAADKTLHVAFLHRPPDADASHRLATIEAGEETLTLVGREIYLHLPGGIGRSKLATEMGKRFKEPVTVRNWRTVNRLREMTLR